MIPNLRNATNDDAELIAQLTRACWVGKPENSSGHRETPEKVLHDLEEGSVIIMELAGVPVGSVRYFPVFNIGENGEKYGPVALEIGRLGILPEHRGHGIGSSIMKSLLEEAEEARKSVTIYVESFNPSRRLFERLGFAEIESDGINLLLERPAGKESQ